MHPLILLDYKTLLLQLAFNSHFKRAYDSEKNINAAMLLKPIGKRFLSNRKQKHDFIVVLKNVLKTVSFDVCKKKGLSQIFFTGYLFCQFGKIIVKINFFKILYKNFSRRSL